MFIAFFHFYPSYPITRAKGENIAICTSKYVKSGIVCQGITQCIMLYSAENASLSGK